MPWQVYLGLGTWYEGRWVCGSYANSNRKNVRSRRRPLSNVIICFAVGGASSTRLYDLSNHPRPGARAHVTWSECVAPRAHLAGEEAGDCELTWRLCDQTTVGGGSGANFTMQVKLMVDPLLMCSSGPPTTSVMGSVKQRERESCRNDRKKLMQCGIWQEELLQHLQS